MAFKVTVSFSRLDDWLAYSIFSAIQNTSTVVSISAPLLSPKTRAAVPCGVKRKAPGVARTGGCARIHSHTLDSLRLDPPVAGPTLMQLVTLADSSSARPCPRVTGILR